MIWHERSGRFSWFRFSTFSFLCLPAIWLVWLSVSNGLGSRPLNAAIHFTGDWAVYFLLTSLAITPARQLSKLSQLVSVRRMVGVAALFYAILHLGLYTANQGYSVVSVVSEIASRFYLLIGFVVLVGLTALGVTSFDSSVKWLGGKRWRMLHRLVYILAPLAMWHFCLQSKVDVSDAIFASGLLIWLLGYRVIAPKGAAPSLWHLLALSIGAGLGAAGVEFAWYGLATRVNPYRVLEANLDLSDPRPAIWVMSVCIVVTVAAATKRLLTRKTNAV